MKQCKKCLIEKDFSDFYTHPQTSDWYLWSCKECIKSERSSPHWRSMARVQDKKRLSDPKRKEYNNKSCRSFRLNNPEKYKAQSMIWHLKRNKRNKHLLTDTCIVCWKIGMIHYHHFDYTKPNEVIPCCAMCHSKFHHDKLIPIDEYKIIFI